MHPDNQTRAPEFAAALARIAVPLLAFGRIVMAVPSLIAVPSPLWVPGQRNPRRTVLAPARSPFGIAFGLKCGGDVLAWRDPALLAVLLAHVGFWGLGSFNFLAWLPWRQVGYLMLTAFGLAGRHDITAESVGLG